MEYREKINLAKPLESRIYLLKAFKLFELPSLEGKGPKNCLCQYLSRSVRQYVSISVGQC